MVNAATDYWKECLSIVLEDEGIKVTDTQLTSIAQAVQSSHENYSLAFYSPPAGEHLTARISELERELTKERANVACPVCHGKGSITTQGPYHSATGTCWKCNGSGKVAG